MVSFTLFQKGASSSVEYDDSYEQRRRKLQESIENRMVSFLSLLVCSGTVS